MYVGCNGLVPGVSEQSGSRKGGLDREYGTNLQPRAVKQQPRAVSYGLTAVSCRLEFLFRLFLRFKSLEPFRNACLSMLK